MQSWRMRPNFGRIEGLELPKAEGLFAEAQQQQRQQGKGRPNHAQAYSEEQDHQQRAAGGSRIAQVDIAERRPGILGPSPRLNKCGSTIVR